MRTRLLPLSSLLLTLACSGPGCGGSASTAASVPRALRARAEHEEVVPYAGFTVPGLTLYRASGAVPDHGWSYVVGIDADGNAVEGAALMGRLGALAPDVFAQRALAILLREEGSTPLTPEDPRPSFATEQEWTIVRAPRDEGESVVFYVMAGEMAPSLDEVSVHRRTFAVTHRSAVDVLLARGETVALHTTCRPFVACGCYDGCKRFTAVRVPPSGEVRYRIEGATTDALYAEAAPCTGARCARVCRADVPDASCDPALIRVDEECGEACPPSEASFHCETLESGCREIAHPVRSGAAR